MPDLCSEMVNLVPKTVNKVHNLPTAAQFCADELSQFPQLWQFSSLELSLSLWLISSYAWKYFPGTPAPSNYICLEFVPRPLALQLIWRWKFNGGRAANNKEQEIVQILREGVIYYFSSHSPILGGCLAPSHPLRTNCTSSIRQPPY